MRISTNPVGNYNLNNVNRTQQTSQVQNAESAKKSEAVDITNKEKKYFAGMYPQNKEEIMKYHFYNSNGKFNGVAVGNNIDRRG